MAFGSMLMALMFLSPSALAGDVIVGPTPQVDFASMSLTSGACSGEVHVVAKESTSFQTTEVKVLWGLFSYTSVKESTNTEIFFDYKFSCSVVYHAHTRASGGVMRQLDIEEDKRAYASSASLDILGESDGGDLVSVTTTSSQTSPCKYDGVLVTSCDIEFDVASNAINRDVKGAKAYPKEIQVCPNGTSLPSLRAVNVPDHPDPLGLTGRPVKAFSASSSCLNSVPIGWTVFEAGADTAMTALLLLGSGSDN